MKRGATLLPIALLTIACTHRQAVSSPNDSSVADRVQVRLVRDEAQAALAILNARARRASVPESAWSKLFATEGYQLLKAREAAMGRAFDDPAFRVFMESDTLLQRVTELRAAVERWRTIDVTSAARRALAYLPAYARIRVSLIPMIKPITNSFVYQSDSTLAMLIYIDPRSTPAQIENTLAHELHHIGYGTACSGPPRTDLPESVRTARLYTGAFGEGLAMLAAAGGPSIHPHALSDTADRNRWDREVGNIDRDLRSVERFLLDVADARIVARDSIQQMAMKFFGVQGPWYTVGWRMAVTIEQEFGKARLLEVMCDPAGFLVTYNEAAAKNNARLPRSTLPLWSQELLTKLRVGH